MSKPMELYIHAIPRSDGFTEMLPPPDQVKYWTTDNTSGVMSAHGIDKIIYKEGDKVRLRAKFLDKNIMRDVVYRVRIIGLQSPPGTNGFDYYWLDDERDNTAHSFIVSNEDILMRVHEKHIMNNKCTCGTEKGSTSPVHKDYCDKWGVIKEKDIR